LRKLIPSFFFKITFKIESKWTFYGNLTNKITKLQLANQFQFSFDYVFLFNNLYDVNKYNALVLKSILILILFLLFLFEFKCIQQQQKILS
jgi:O-antigen ligase